MQRTLHKWLTLLEQRHPRLIDLGLDRIAKVARRLHVTKFSCPVITVAGTNGKGSTVAVLEQMYLAEGYRVGAYTSPHLLRFNERIRINNQEIDDKELCDAFEIVERNLQDISLSYFEFTTLAALVLFQQAQLDILILEVGLGGRLDAVNSVEPDVSVITSISMDHMDWLGPNRESIGREKAGIFRSDKYAICGDPNSPQSVIRKKNYYQQAKDFYYQENNGSWDWCGPKKTYTALPIPAIQLQNAATALMVTELVQKPLSLNAIHQGLKKVKVVGRLQIITKPKLMILDVSHNPAAIQLLANYLQAHPCAGLTIAVVGMLADKDILGNLQPLLTQINQWQVGSITAARGADAALLTEKLQQLGVKRYHSHASIELAYQHALKESGPLDRLVVFGSFYTVSAVLALLKSGEDVSVSQDK